MNDLNKNTKEGQTQLTEAELESVAGGRMPWDVPRPLPRFRRKSVGKKGDDDEKATT